MFKKIAFSIGIFVCGIQALMAQETQKQYLDWGYWSMIQGEYHLPYNHFIFFENNIRKVDFPPTNISSDLPFSRMHNMLGFEYRLTGKTACAFSGRLVNEAAGNIFIPRVYLKHYGKFFGLDFIKHLAFENFSFQYDRTSYGRISFWLLLSKSFEVGQHKIRPEFSYEIFRRTDEGYSGKENRRLIDRTRLKVEVVFAFLDRYEIGVFGLRDTQYMFALGTSPDPNNVPPDYNLNLIQPIVGTMLRIKLGEIGDKEETEQPTE